MGNKSYTLSKNHLKCKKDHYAYHSLNNCRGNHCELSFTCCNKQNIILCIDCMQLCNVDFKKPFRCNNKCKQEDTPEEILSEIYLDEKTNYELQNHLCHNYPSITFTKNTKKTTCSICSNKK